MAFKKKKDLHMHKKKPMGRRQMEEENTKIQLIISTLSNQCVTEHTISSKGQILRNNEKKSNGACS